MNLQYKRETYISGPLCSPARHPHDLCKHLELNYVSAKQLRSEDDNFRASQCNMTMLIYSVLKENGGLFGVLARCYYGKLICVCYCVILPLQ